MLSQCDIKKAVGETPGQPACARDGEDGDNGCILHMALVQAGRHGGIPEIIASLPPRQRDCPQGRKSNKSSLSLSSPTQSVRCRGGICSVGRGQGLNPGQGAGRSAAQDIQAAQLAECSQCHFSHVCVAADAALLPEDGKEKAALQEERTESRRLLQDQEEEEQLRDASQARSTRVAQDIHIQVS